jgi:hypothetical protein
MSGRLFFLITLLFSPALAAAGIIRIDSTTAYAQYRDDNLALQNPFFEFFKGSYASSHDDFQLDTNFSVTDNPTDSQQSNFDLYALDGSVWVVPDQTKITFGRSFYTHMTVRPRVLDSLAVEHFMFDKMLRLGGYVGIERPPEDLTRERSKISGVSVGYVSPQVAPLTANLRFEHQVFDVVQRDRMKLSLSKTLQYSLSPELMVDVERDLKYGIFSRSEAGVDIYPTIKSTFGLRYQIYELDPLTQVDEPILNVLSQGRTQEISAKAGYFLSRDLYGSYYYAHNSFLVQSGYSAFGERHQVALDAVVGWSKLNLTLYRITSYGGWVEGGRGGIGAKLSSRIDLFAQTEYSSYAKITSSHRTALSNELGITYSLSGAMHIDVIGEWNSNNSAYRDQRFFIKFTYLTWKET